MQSRKNSDKKSTQSLFDLSGTELREKFYELAARLITIPSFKPLAIEATADDLARWCTGRDLNGTYWSPEDQAEYLVNCARESMPIFSTAGLYQIFLAKFHPEPGSGNAAKPLGGRPVFNCAICEDANLVRTQTGKLEYCTCADDESRKELAWMLEMENRERKVAARNPSIASVGSIYFQGNRVLCGQPPRKRSKHS